MAQWVKILFYSLTKVVNFRNKENRFGQRGKKT